jgi:hypothetical protein
VGQLHAHDVFALSLSIVCAATCALFNAVGLVGVTGQVSLFELL